MRLSQNLTFSWRTICCFKDKKKKTNVNNGGLLTSCPAIGQISDTHTPSQIGITTMFVNSFNHCSRQIQDITTWALQQQAYKDDISRILKRTTSYYFRTSMKGREICYFGHSMRKNLLWWNTGVEGTAGLLSGQAQARIKFCQARIHLGHLRKPRELQLSSKQQFFECLSPTPLLKCCNSRILQYISRLETKFQYIW